MKEAVVVMRGTFGADGTLDKVVGPARVFLDLDRALAFADELEKRSER